MRSSNYLRQAKRRQNRSPEATPTLYSPTDQVAGKESLANVLDVSVTSIERWIRDDMPVEQRGDLLHEWIFQLDKVKLWRLDKFGE